MPDDREILRKLYESSNYNAPRLTQIELQFYCEQAKHDIGQALSQLRKYYLDEIMKARPKQRHTETGDVNYRAGFNYCHNQFTRAIEEAFKND